MTTTTQTGTGPKCPNHNCPLILSENDKKQTRGAAPCAISGALFDFTQTISTDDVTFVKDKNGNLQQVHKFTVTGEEN